MEQRITDLQQEIAELREQVQLLTAAVEKLTGTTQRMDTHIDFVEQAYTTLRSPLDYVRRRFEGWGTTGEPLPAPPTHDETNQELNSLI